MDAEIPALLCKGALEALGAQMDFAKDTLLLERRGICVPLGLKAMGHYVMSVVEFGKGRPKRTRGPQFSASYFEWPLMDQRPDLSDGGLHLPLKESGLLRFATPKKFVACAAATLREAQDEGAADPKKIIMKLHANWGHASANQLKRILVDSDSGMSHLVAHVDSVLENCEVCRAFDKAPHLPIAGTSSVSCFNERVQVDLLFLDDIIAARAMDVFSKYSLLHRVKSKNPQEVRDVFCAGWLGTFGPPKCLQMDEGGERKNEVWADYCTERRIKLLFQGVGAHPWLLGRRNGLARGIYNRLVEDDRFSSEEILGEVQWRLNTMLATSGFSAYQMVFGSNPADLFGWGDSEEDLLFAQDASSAGQFVNQ